MKSEIFLTDDGSQSLYNAALNEPYHSRHGAVTESKHVYIQMGLNALNKAELAVLEIGLGTGLNLLLTWQEAQQKNLRIAYTALELFPVKQEVWEKLDYRGFMEEGIAEKGHLIHRLPWEEVTHPDENISVLKLQKDLIKFHTTSKYDLIYFDAFGPEVQPELWTAEVFSKLFGMMNSGGKLVTYSAKGQVRRNMIAAGFTVERLPGPPGKREMLRASCA